MYWKCISYHLRFSLKRRMASTRVTIIAFGGRGGDGGGREGKDKRDIFSRVRFSRENVIEREN